MQTRPQIPTPEEIAKLPTDGGPDWNRLVFEQSPYLLQHAANPVDWYPWSDEAFEAARRDDKPIFLSIGYSTCHWCHVMEHESFEDEQVARLMNEAFICVKVDREERPDIDNVYMTVTQAMTGSGGWPMTIMMTADKKPFFAGTYFPKDSRYGRPGMIDLVPHIEKLWDEDREKLIQSADYIADELGKITGSFPGDELTTETLKTAFRDLGDRFDPVRGGFGARPKFPTPHNLTYLLRYHQRTGEPEALMMVEKTLKAMRLGGIFDHVGYGFHRYSTDENWLLPHFEKMLYDQAMLAIAYAETYQVTGNPFYRETAEEIYRYVIRDMTSPEGGFYSAEDADSEGEEGKFYVWSNDELREVLGKNDADLYASVYGFSEEGNFYEESTGRTTGQNIPHLEKPLADVARDLKLPPEELEMRLESARKRLFEVREERIHPLKDDKILTSWNGLMIAAFAKGAQAFEEPEYAEAASRAADFVLDKLTDQNGRLLKRSRNGQAGLSSHLEDYAYMCWGLLELYEATFDEKYLVEANRLAGDMIEHYWDDSEEGFFLSADDGEQLIVRSKDAYDGATPSGNSVAAYVLLRLSRMTGNTNFEQKATETITAFSKAVDHSPRNFTFLMSAVDFLLGPSYEIVLAGTNNGEMANTTRRMFLPRTVTLERPENESSPLFTLAPFLKEQVPPGQSPTAFICREYACERPVTNPGELVARLTEIQKSK